jgi:hypothetical protein
MSEPKDETPPMFTITKRFQLAVELINEITGDALRTLLRVLTGKLAAASTATFSDAETEKLEELLEVTATQLATVLGATSYVFEQAAYHGADSAKLSTDLTGAGMSPDAAAAFAAAWQDDACAAFLERLRKHTLGAPATLTGVDWCLQLTMGHSSAQRQRDLNAVVSFHLADANSGSGGGGGDVGGEGQGNESLAVELDREGLEALYTKMEKIQEQLDGLNRGN